MATVINYKKEVAAMAAEIGAEILVEKTEDGYFIEVSAPDGKRWDDGPSTLTARYGGTFGPASEAWQDLCERMAEGVTDRDDE